MTKNHHTCNNCVASMLGVFDEGFNDFKAKFKTPPKDDNQPIKIYLAKKIITMNDLQPEATAIAVSNGLIYAIGELKNIQAGLEKAKKSYEVDKQFKNDVILPGFIESHCHSVLLGLLWQWLYLGADTTPNSEGKLCGGYKTKKAAIKGLKQAFTKRSNKKTPLFAWGYDPCLINDSPDLTCQDLDSISNEIPIIVMHSSCHAVSVNSATLNIMGYDKNTQITGVLKDEKGKLTGILKEPEAFFSIFNEHFKLDAATLEKSIWTAAKIGARMGCTTLSELALGYIPHSWDALNTVTNQKNCPVRISSYVLNFILENIGGIDAIKKHMENNNDRLRLNGVKFVADGSIQGYTANMKWPHYYDGTPNGFPNITDEEMKKEFIALHKAGVQCAIHVNGDQELENILAILKEVLSTFPRNDHRHRIEHCQLPTTENLECMAKYDILANVFTNHIYYWGDFHKNHSLGPDRVQQLDPARSFKDYGVRFALHSDATCTPLNPLKMIWTAAVRKTSKTGEVLGQDQCLSVADGLRAATIDSAYLLGEDATKGSLEIGKFADLAILDKDPLNVKVDDLLKIKIKATMCDGKIFKQQ